MTDLCRVGILGGMGPQATVLVMQRVLDTLNVLVSEIVRFATGAALEVTRWRQTA